MLGVTKAPPKGLRLPLQKGKNLMAVNAAKQDPQGGGQNQKVACSTREQTLRPSRSTQARGS